MTLLATIITLGNSENRNEIHRTESVFELIDFNKNGRVSFDELVCIYFLYLNYIIIPKYLNFLSLRQYYYYVLVLHLHL